MIYAPNNYGFVEDMAFSCYAQASEGDFTVGKDKLDAVAEAMAYNWEYLRVQPDTIAARCVCQNLGFKYSDLLNEEIIYLSNRVEEEIKKYGK